MGGYLIEVVPKIVHHIALYNHDPTYRRYMLASRVLSRIPQLFPVILHSDLVFYPTPVTVRLFFPQGFARCRVPDIYIYIYIDHKTTSIRNIITLSPPLKGDVKHPHPPPAFFRHRTFIPSTTTSPTNGWNSPKKIGALEFSKGHLTVSWWLNQPL